MRILAKPKISEAAMYASLNGMRDNLGPRIGKLENPLGFFSYSRVEGYVSYGFNGNWVYCEIVEL